MQSLTRAHGGMVDRSRPGPTIESMIIARWVIYSLAEPDHDTHVRDGIHYGVIRSRWSLRT